MVLTCPEKKYPILESNFITKLKYLNYLIKK